MPNYDLEIADSVIASRDLEIERLIKETRNQWNALDLIITLTDRGELTPVVRDIRDIAIKARNFTQQNGDDVCPECHDTGKTVISKTVGVEDCPECNRD